jgi:hypothetical protein
LFQESKEADGGEQDKHVAHVDGGGGAVASLVFFFGPWQNCQYPKKPRRMQILMHRQKKIVPSAHEICTFSNEKKTPELFSSLPCNSQLGA